MNGIKVELKGFNEAIKKLDIHNLEQAITDELDDFGRGVVRDAKQNLSTHGTIDFGFLTNSINSETKPLSVTISAHKDYAAYVEFGTGPYAASYVPSLEPEWQAIARQFFVNGKGRMHAQPYLHPAIEKNLLLLKDNLKSLFKT